MAADLIWFEVTVPPIRRPADGPEDAQDVTLRFPSTDEDTATEAAREIAWVIVDNLPKEPDNNRHGWKLANYGIAVEPVST
jgi:hypothetical protein